MQARRFSFTDFKLREDEWKQLYKNGTISFLVYGREICPDTHRDHLQGYFEIPKKRTLAGLIKKDINWCHLAISRGNAKQNIDYCSKDKDFVILGEPMVQGAREELKKVIDDYVTGATDLETIADNDVELYHKYRHTMREVKLLKIKPRTQKPAVVWFWGKSGTGKTREAFIRAMDYTGLNENAIFWYTPTDNGFWDGYEGQKVVIFDDFRGNHVEYNELLRKLDRYPNKCKIKGKSPIEFNAELIIITSCYSPYECYKGRIERGDNLDQLIRRIDEIACLNPEGEADIQIDEAPWTDQHGNIIDDIDAYTNT